MLNRMFVIAFSVLLGACVAGKISGASNAFAQNSTRARQTNTSPSAETTLTISEQFLNSLLDAMFTKLKAPTFPLALAGAKPDGPALPSTNSFTSSNNFQCASVIVLQREMSGVKTAVHFENGRITAPLAFSGSYSLGFLGCTNFQGWAETAINLEFNRERQVLSARVKVKDIHLNNVPPVGNTLIVGLVQNSIDKRINPVEILQAAQLATRLPIAAAGGALRLRAKEVRPEVVQGALRLHIVYEFARDE